MPSRHAFDLHTFFAFDSGCLPIAGGLKEVWYAPVFLLNCSTCVLVAAPGITRSSRKRIVVARFRKTPEMDLPVSR